MDLTTCPGTVGQIRARIARESRSWGFWVPNYPARNINWKKKLYRILLVFEILNNKILILSRFQAFRDLNIPYLKFSRLNVSQENEAEVEKEIM